MCESVDASCAGKTPEAFSVPAGMGGADGICGSVAGGAGDGVTTLLCAACGGDTATETLRVVRDGMDGFGNGGASGGSANVVSGSSAASFAAYFSELAVNRDVARAELVLVLGGEELDETFLFDVKRANSPVVRGGDELTCKTASSPFQVTHVRPVRFEIQNAVFAAVAVFLGGAVAVVVHAPKSDVPVFVARADENRSAGVVRRHVKVSHASGNNLSHGLVHQR